MRHLLILICIMMLWSNGANGIEIVSPAQQAVVMPGEQITVSVVPSPGETVLAVTVIDPAGQAIRASANGSGGYSAQVTIPRESACIELLGIAAATAGGRASFRALELKINPGTLEGLTLSTDGRFTTKGKVAPLNVSAKYADGVTRLVGDPACGTIFSSSDPSIAAVHPFGLIQPRANGQATITVTSFGQTVQLPVTVRLSTASSQNQIPVAAADDQVALPEYSIRLDGMASSDADGDPLTFAWQQESGRIVILEAGNTARPYFITPNVNVETELTFSLTVSDNQGASTLPKIVKVTVRPPAP